jgi:uncharacterized membrane protein (GlpM family)
MTRTIVVFLMSIVLAYMIWLWAHDSMQYNMQLDNGNCGKSCCWMVDIFDYLVRRDY